jgi:tetratricopeptide (TPR) repeat protein
MLVAPEILEIAAGEFKGILADYLLLKASVFLGGRYKTTENDWLAVYHLFKQSLALDPYFFQTCYFIQAILPWEAKMPEKAVELLDISRKHRYWDWQPGYYIGFDYFYFLKDNNKAAKQLMEAAKIPGAPRIISSLASRMAHKSGQTELAIAFLQTMYDKAKDENTRAFLQDRIKAHTGILVLEKAVLLFWQKYDYIPGSLDDLVLKGIISELPENPYGDTRSDSTATRCRQVHLALYYRSQRIFSISPGMCVKQVLHL